MARAKYPIIEIEIENDLIYAMILRDSRKPWQCIILDCDTARLLAKRILEVMETKPCKTP